MMKRMLLLALAVAVSPLFAGDLADFGNGLGRVALGGRPGFTEAFEPEFIEDAIAAAPAKVLKVKLAAPKEKSARFDVNMRISAEEAANAKSLAFDVRADKPASVWWISLYFFPEKRQRVHMIAPSGLWRGTKPNEWKHIEVPVEKFIVKDGEMQITDARQVFLSFFCYGPVELQFANIKLLDK